MDKPDLKSIVPDLEFSAEFVPWSKSRNAKEKDPCLNWKVTFKTPRGSLTTDYTAGCAHCPSYKGFDIRQCDVVSENVYDECEKGFPMWRGRSESSMGVTQFKKKPILPNEADVMYSLLLDSDVLDCPSFEDWAESIGYDTDSRKAEKIYNDCLKIALKLRIMLGDEKLAALREAFQDY